MDNYKIVYGDSVDGKTIININGKYVPIESLFTKIDYVVDDKEYCNLHEITVTLDDDGNSVCAYTQYVMRHKTNKEMYRVWFTNSTYIDVTEDHSLITFKNNKFYNIKPTEKLTNLIWEKRNIQSIHSKHYSKETYEFLGLFMGDGSVIYKNKKSHYGWLSCGLDLDEIMEKVIKPLQLSGMIKSVWIKKKGDICFNGKILSIIDEHIKTPNGKQFPEFMMHEPSTNCASFMRGWFTADGTCITRNNNPIIRLTSINTEHIIKAQECLLNCGVSSNWFTETKENSYNGNPSGTFSKHLIVKQNTDFYKIGFILDRKQQRIKRFIKKENDIVLIRPIKIEKINTPEYVYDIEIGKYHRFFGNHVLLHNTDSVAVSGVETIEDGFKLEKKVNNALLNWARKNQISDEFAPTVKFEKYYKKMFFKKKSGGEEAAKKKYVGHLIWKDGLIKDTLEYTGIETKRSDTAPITKALMEEFFKTILLENNPEKAIKNVKDVFNKVNIGNISAHEIAVPKGVNKMDNNTAHVKGLRNGIKLFGLNFDASMKPKLLYCKTPYTELCVDDTITEEEIKKKVTIDYEKMADRVIAQKMRSLIESLGYNWDAVIGGQRNLNDLFGDEK